MYALLLLGYLQIEQARLNAQPHMSLGIYEAWTDVSTDVAQPATHGSSSNNSDAGTTSGRGSPPLPSNWLSSAVTATSESPAIGGHRYLQLSVFENCVVILLVCPHAVWSLFSNWCFLQCAVLFAA
jgi:hypothetical protein